MSEIYEMVKGKDFTINLRGKEFSVKKPNLLIQEKITKTYQKAEADGGATERTLCRVFMFIMSNNEDFKKDFPNEEILMGSLDMDDLSIISQFINEMYEEKKGSMEI